MQRRLLGILFVTIFLDLIGFGMLLPIIPQLLANPDSAYLILPAGWSIDRGYLLLGLLVSIFPLGQFLATPVLGQLSDKFGRKKLLVFSLAGSFVSYTLFAVAISIANIPLLFVARFLNGLVGGNVAIAQASVADVTVPESRARNFGLLSSAYGLGFILGPYLGGKFSDPSFVGWFDAATPFWLASILALVNAGSVALFLPETNKVPSRSLVVHWSRSLRNITRAMNAHSLRPLFLTTFLFQAGFVFFVTFFTVHLITRFSFSQNDIGEYFAYTALCIALTQGLVTRVVSRWFNEEQILRVSLFGAGIGLALYFLPSSAYGLYMIAPVFAIFIGLSQTNLGGLISRSAPSNMQGEALGISSSLQALAQLIPSALSGFLAVSFAPEVPLITASLVVILAGFVFTLSYKQLPR